MKGVEDFHVASHWPIQLKRASSVGVVESWFFGAQQTLMEVDEPAVPPYIALNPVADDPTHLVPQGSHFVDLNRDKLTVRYTGKGNHAGDIGYVYKINHSVNSSRSSRTGTHTTAFCETLGSTFALLWAAFLLTTLNLSRVSFVVCSSQPNNSSIRADRSFSTGRLVSYYEVTLVSTGQRT
jgi:hypothetical protein